jgi:hypothetical protein
MIREAYEAGVKQALVDALADEVGSPAIRVTPAPPAPPASPMSPTKIDGNAVPPVPMSQQGQSSDTPDYNEGVKRAMIAAGLYKIR